MHHISLSSLVVFGAICLLYALVVLAILQFCKVAKLKPNPPESSTVRVELTISARAPADAYPDKSAGPSITTTFVFADAFATTVTDFLAGYHSPSRADFLNFLQQTDGLIADLLINRQYDTLVRSLTLLGKDAEDVTSFLTHCFNCQLASMRMNSTTNQFLGRPRLAGRNINLHEPNQKGSIAVMAGSVNLTILLGNVGIDPKIQYTTNGTPVARFTLATNSQYVDKSTGELKETTAWHNLVMYGEKPADVIKKYVKKGNPLHVVGHLAYRRWTDNDNVQHNFTQVVIDSFTLLSRRPASSPNEAAPDPASDNGTAPISVEADNGTELTDDSPF